MLWYYIKHDYFQTKCAYYCDLTKLLWQRESPAETTNIVVLACSYLKNELSDPPFLLLRSDQKAKMKLSAKLKKILYCRIKATFKKSRD